MDVHALSQKILDETKKIIVGKDEKIKLIVMALLSKGNVLLDDLPGSGKTTLVKTIAIATGCSFGRIQFVSDMLPSDIIGMQIYNQKTGDFELRKGPVMTNILLADEINRAIPRTQSALLEAMEEGQVTIDNQSFTLPAPFIVLATENPVESESTFKLPVAQMDRFLVSFSLGYLEENDEIEMLKKVGNGTPFENVKAVTDGRQIIEAQEFCKTVFVSDAVSRYIVKIVNRTRNEERLKMGASPRASRSLYQAGKAWAAMDGRDFVTPDDIKFLAPYVLEHRMLLENSSQYSGATLKGIIEEILEEIPVEESIKDNE